MTVTGSGGARIVCLRCGAETSRQPLTNRCGQCRLIWFVWGKLIGETCLSYYEQPVLFEASSYFPKIFHVPKGCLFVVADD